MTVEAQRPTGNPGPAPAGRPGTTPRGPAGPRPQTTTPRPDQQAPPPSSPKQLAEHLDSIVLLLRTAQLVADRKLADADPALRMALAERLRLARRAVADLQTPARRDPKSVATSGGPGRAGGPPAPGAGYTRMPRLQCPSPFEIGVGPLYDALPGRR